MLSRATALLFDNDGVLVDSHASVEIGWSQWALEYVPGFSLTSEWHGRRAQDIVFELVGAELFEEANLRINELEQESAHLTVALDGSVELTSSLTAGTWNICTSANPNLGRARLAAAGIPIPAELVTAYDVERGKPHPDPYLLGAKRLGAPIAECVVFEDAQAGIEAGLAAGAGLIIGVSPKALDTEAKIVVQSLAGITFVNGDLVIPDAIRLR